MTLRALMPQIVCHLELPDPFQCLQQFPSQAADARDPGRLIAAGVAN
jgi:hypothetical protein